MVVPTREESVAINAGIAADPDTYELSASEFKALRQIGRSRVAIKGAMFRGFWDDDSESLTPRMAPSPARGRGQG